MARQGGPHVQCDMLGALGSELQLLCCWKSRLSPLLSSGWTEQAQWQIMTLVSFCSTGENTVSPDTFQHPDGAKVVSEPQVRARSPPKASGFLVTGLLSHTHTPSSAWLQLALPRSALFLLFPPHGVLRCGNTVFWATQSHLPCPPMPARAAGRRSGLTGLLCLTHSPYRHTEHSPRPSRSWKTLDISFFLCISTLLCSQEGSMAALSFVLGGAVRSQR